MMAGGIWVHKIERCGSAAEIVARAGRLGADRLIVKSRDGRSAYNAKEIGPLASLALAAGLELWIWAWPYSTAAGGRLGYIAEQAGRIGDDARRLGAAGVCLNIEAPFSWGHGHRWADLHAEQYGTKAQRKTAIRMRTRELLELVRDQCRESRIAVSTFPTPSAHATASDLMAQLSDEVWPQCYFRGPGWDAKIGKSILQWEKLGAEVIRFTGPAWRGSTKARAMVSAVRKAQGLDAPIDFWVLDKLDPADDSAIGAMMGGQCPVIS